MTPGFVAPALAGDTRERAFLATGALLFLASAGATVYWCGSMSSGMPMPGGWSMSMAWMRMPGQSWLGAAASFMGMWMVMMVAMMLPSLVSMLSGYRGSFRGLDAARRGRLTAVAGAGYFFVWTLVGAAVYPFGVVLGSAAMRWPALARALPFACSIVFLLAGCFQLTAWKARLLERCRSAPGCGPSRSLDARRAWRHGLGLGLHCSLCCCGFMMVLLVSGVMDLGVMALVAAAITVERFAPKPARVARAMGMVVVALGAFLIVRAVVGAM